MANNTSNTDSNQPPLYGRYTRQPATAGTSSYELEDFVGAKFYCPHALADGNQRIRIREKTLVSPYYPRESFREGLWNHRRTFVCLFVCLLPR